MDPHKNRIGNCESCLKMRFLVKNPEKCENANSNAKSFKNAKKNASISGKGLLVGTVKESYLLQLSVALYTFGSRSAGGVGQY